MKMKEKAFSVKLYKQVAHKQAAEKERPPLYGGRLTATVMAIAEVSFRSLGIAGRHMVAAAVCLKDKL